MNRTPLSHRVALLAVVAIFACACLRMASAQNLASASPPAPKEFRAFHVRFVNPTFASEALHGLMDDDERASVRICPGASGTLLVLAPPEAYKKIGDMIRVIDQAPPPEPESQIKVFTLANADPASAVKVLATLLPKGTRVAVDERTRSLILSGSRDALGIAEAMLSRLDERAIIARPKPSTNFEVRVVWLTNDDKGALPAADLKDVVAELSRLDVKDPRQIGCLMVQTSSDHSFHLVSSPVFAGRRAKLTAAGILSEQTEGVVTMEVAINAVEVGYTATGQVEHNLSEISTRIVMPQRQYVVLAITPATTTAGSITSAFVVQVTRRTNVGEKK
jgi:hypothetical protein